MLTLIDAWCVCRATYLQQRLSTLVEAIAAAAQPQGAGAGAGSGVPEVTEAELAAVAARAGFTFASASAAAAAAAAAEPQRSQLAPPPPDGEAESWSVCAWSSSPAAPALLSHPPASLSYTTHPPHSSGGTHTMFQRRLVAHCLPGQGSQEPSMKLTTSSERLDATITSHPLKRPHLRR